MKALAELATVLNLKKDAAMFHERQAKMAAKVNAHLWDSTLGLYFNFQQDTQTFNTHTSPTSFYPMLSGTATVEQAEEMITRWMMNHSGYCLNTTEHAAPASSPVREPTPAPPTAPPTALSPCKYGLPSTPNNDLNYRDDNYWRGRVWGPLNLLVYIGLRHPKYAASAVVKEAREQLVKSSREALMVEWLMKHHVHENLNPDTGSGDGSSNPMYHWGALLGFLEVWESGNF